MRWDTALVVLRSISRKPQHLLLKSSFLEAFKDEGEKPVQPKKTYNKLFELSFKTSFVKLSVL